MSPIAAIQNALKLDRAAATVIVVGIAAFAAVAVVKTFNLGDPAGSLLSVGYIVLAGFTVSIIGAIMGDRVAKLVLSWAVTAVIVLFMGTIAFGAIVPGQAFVNPPSCVLRFWAPCRETLDQIGEAQPPVVLALPRPPTPGTPSAAPSSAKIFIQFAGVIARTNVVKVATALAEQGWDVQDPARGGERTPSAAGQNEVRYANPALKDAAELLARQLTATGITAATIKAQKVGTPGFPPNQLEVWISR